MSAMKAECLHQKLCTVLVCTNSTWTRKCLCCSPNANRRYILFISMTVRISIAELHHRHLQNSSIQFNSSPTSVVAIVNCRSNAQFENLSFISDRITYRDHTIHSRRLWVPKIKYSESWKIYKLDFYVIIISVLQFCFEYLWWASFQ